MPSPLSANDVDRVLMHMGMIAPEAAVAFRARFKHLQRLGIPLGSNMGKGRRVPHGLDTLFQLVISLELLQVGLPPAMVARTIEWNWSVIREALVWISAPAQKVREQRTRWADGNLFLLQSPTALEALMDIQQPEAERGYDDVRVVHADALAGAIIEGAPEQLGPGRMLTLNLGWLTSETLAQLLVLSPGFDLMTAWRDWRALSEETTGREIFLNDDEETGNVDPKA